MPSTIENTEEIVAEDISTSSGRTVSVPVATVVRGAAFAVLTAALCVTTTLWLTARSDSADQRTAAANTQRAEQVAMDYAVGASTIDNGDFTAWVGRLKANTAPQLATKFDATAPKLEQILVPLKWTSSAKPITAKVADENAGVYRVNAFVSVNSTSSQTPEGGLMTVTYTVTIDSNADWKITDVGGMDGALPLK
ncbi:MULTISPECIES: hypothetical protein [unclassified Nocardia]|uniref:hypothetical protein n=1 Tax=unclassified Nocardia TaxID=2637762 RepID=UPI0033AD564C